VHHVNGIDSKFRLAILVARRAKQLIGGAKKKVDIKADNPLTIAMEEFKQGKIDFDILNEDNTLLNEESEGSQTEAADEIDPELESEANDGAAVEVAGEIEEEPQPGLEP
jgi:DNA-directed RNA polymerase subunit omega